MPIITKYTSITAAICLAAVSQVHAISFVLNFDDTNSLTPDFDSDGSQLTAIMESAAEYWEDVILDTQTINITYFWDDLNDPAIGNHTGTAFSGNIETGMTLRFDTQNNAGTARNWYFDPDPTTHDEFNLQSSLYRDLDTANQVGGGSAWYSGNPQDYFEAGFRGDWADGTTTSTDLFTVALHEIGHGLGMTAWNAASVTETNDNDYDLITSLTDGQTLAINTGGSTSNLRAHIAPTMALMFSGYQGGRALPSYSDVLSMASVSGWSQIDLPRKYFASGSDFNADANWLGSRAPDSGDDVYILSDDAVALTNSAFLNSLTIEEGNSLDADDEILFVFSDLNLAARQGAPGSTPDISVGTGGLISLTGDMNVAGGSITLNGGEINVGSELNFSDVDARTPFVRGQGELRVFTQINGAADFFADNGQTLEIVDAGPGQTLAISRIAAATSGNLRFTDFDKVELQANATLVIGPNRNATINNLDTAAGLTHNELPEVFLNGTPGNPTALILTGANSRISANIHVNNSALVTGAAEWGGGTVHLDDASDFLLLDSPTTFDGVEFTGDGTLFQYGQLLVTGNSTVGTKYFDWDGDTANPVNTQINSGGRLTINASQIEPIGFGTGYDGVVTVYGLLQVNTYLELLDPLGGPGVQVPDRWKLNPAGVISLISDSDVFGTTASGSGVEVFGTVEAFGKLSFISSIALEPGGIVNVNDFTADLRLLGETRLRGGTILGNGKLTNQGEIFVDANMSIDTQKFQWSRTTFAKITVGDNHTFTINAPQLNDNNEPFEGSIHVGVDATLTVNSSGITEWGNIGVITLAGGQINGKPVHNMDGGVIEGNGLIFGTTFTNDGVIRPNNEGLIRIHTTGTPDLDGVDNNGHIDVTDGDFFAKSITPFGPVDVDFHGTIAVDSGFSFTINNSINFNLFGEITSDEGTIDVINFLNQGTVRGDTGFTNVYHQLAQGTLALELAGTAVGAYDRLVSNASALLAGNLQIDFAPGYTPSVGDSFTIINANNILGDFDSILAPAGFIFDLQYPTSASAVLTLLQITSSIPGDLDGDGFVGIDDLNLVLANWNLSVPPADPLADPSGDGFVGIDDLNTVLGNWNAGTPPNTQANIPEPASAGIFLLLAGGWFIPRRRRSGDSTR